jgi:hypothetical protein
MWGNIILAATNLYGLYGAFCYFEAGMYWYGALLLTSVICAVIRHLIEVGHHHMQGVGPKVSPGVQKAWALLTTAVDITVALATLWVFPVRLLYLKWYLLIGLACLALPELPWGFAPREDTLVYVGFHAAGHLYIYHVWVTVAACVRNMMATPPRPC